MQLNSSVDEIRRYFSNNTHFLDFLREDNPRGIYVIELPGEAQFAFFKLLDNTHQIALANLYYTSLVLDDAVRRFAINVVRVLSDMNYHIEIPRTNNR